MHTFELVAVCIPLFAHRVALEQHINELQAFTLVKTV